MGISRTLRINNIKLSVLDLIPCYADLPIMKFEVGIKLLLKAENFLEGLVPSIL